MRQTLRFNTFETNSSSVHSLIIISEEEFEKFKKGETYFKIDNDKFLTKEEIEQSDFFLREVKGFDNAESFEKDNLFNEFMEDFCDCDYPEFATYHGLDLATREVYDKDGNKQIAFSYYING